MPNLWRGRTLWRVLFGLFVIAFLAGNAIAVGNVFAGAPSARQSIPIGQDDVTRPIVRYADVNSGSVPLKTVFPLYEKYADYYEIPRKLLPNRTNPAQPEAPDPNWQDTPVQPNIAGPLTSWEGINNINGVLPPDPTGDIGPNHYVQAVNLAFAIYDRAGNKLYGPANINTLFNGMGGVCQTSNDGDPIVQYDHLADRWLISQFALPNYPRGPFYQCIAISKTGDPTGEWWRYQFTVSNTKMNDYPKFGVWPDGYYMSVNQFNQGRLTWGGQGVVVFERDRMLSGQTARMVYFDLFNQDANLGGMLPADLDGSVPPSGAPNPYIQVDDNAWGYSPDQLQVWNFHVDWITTANSTFTKALALPVTAFDSNMCSGSRNCVPQPGGTKVDAIADRLMYRLQYRNFGDHEALVVNHTVDAGGTDRAGVRWYELRKTAGAWSLYQHGTYSPDATHRWMASVAMNGVGDIGLGFSASSTSVYPSVRYTGRFNGDAAGQMTQGETDLVTGGGYQSHSSGRWGDYSQISVDPVDDCTFWYTQEYYKDATASAGWATRIGSFRLRDCAAPVPTPTPTHTPTTGPSPTPTNTPTNTPIPPTATPTATPAPANSMHVGDLDGQGVSTSNLRWRADVTITVHDGNHAPVNGASVSGGWSIGGTSSCTTAANGACTVTLSNLGKARNANVTYTVNGVTKSGYTYQLAANHDPESDSSGTAIIVNRP